MTIEIRLYKLYDADLMALSSHGVSVPMLIRACLGHYVRGKPMAIHLPQTCTFDIKGRKKVQHLSFEIDDEKSVEYLKRYVKFRQRSAFLKNLVRGYMTAPNIGPYIRAGDAVKADTRMLSSVPADRFENLMVLNLKEQGRRRAEDIIRPAGDTGKKEKPKKPVKQPAKKEKDASRFGDVADLAIGSGFGLDGDDLTDEGADEFPPVHKTPAGRRKKAGGMKPGAGNAVRRETPPDSVWEPDDEPEEMEDDRLQDTAFGLLNGLMNN